MPRGACLFGWALALSGLLLPPGAQAQTRHAVFVGINDYVHFDDQPGGDLLGAERDARVVREVLEERWGLDPENALTLLGRSATKEAVRDALTIWLAGRAEPGDLAVFYFAGHGSQVFDLDGDEPDGLDETIAPADVLPTSSANDIRDDELRAWLATIGADVVVILDSCHSGTASRASGMRTRSLERPIPPEGAQGPTAVRQRYDPESMADATTRILELAAAGPNQSALEGPLDASGVEHGGVFTRHLVRSLRDADPSSTYEQIMSAVAARLDDEELGQSPQILGEGRIPLFTTPAR